MKVAKEGCKDLGLKGGLGLPETLATDWMERNSDFYSGLNVLNGNIDGEVVLELLLVF